MHFRNNTTGSIGFSRSFSLPFISPFLPLCTAAPPPKRFMEGSSYWHRLAQRSSEAKGIADAKNAADARGNSKARADDGSEDEPDAEGTTGTGAASPAETKDSEAASSRTPNRGREHAGAVKATTVADDAASPGPDGGRVRALVCAACSRPVASQVDVLCFRPPRLSPNVWSYEIELLDADLCVHSRTTTTPLPQHAGFSTVNIVFRPGW